MKADIDDLRMFEQSRAAADALAGQDLRIAPRRLGAQVPQLPRDITEMVDENLMDLFTRLTSWVDYLSVQVACAQVDERAAQRNLDYAEATAMANDWGGKESRVAIAKAKLALDPKVVALREDLDDKHAYRKLIETLASNLDRDAALISRELTRRTSAPTTVRRAGRNV